MEFEKVSKTTTVVRKISSARRHVVKVSNIVAEKTKYTKRRSRTKNLTELATDRIAIFANEYVPSHFSESTEWISYTLEVNGITYDIVPLNSHKPGIKIIKYSLFKEDESHVLYLDEPIKEAYLTISIKTPNNSETPYVSNLKVVTGQSAQFPSGNEVEIDYTYGKYQGGDGGGVIH